MRSYEEVLRDVTASYIPAYLRARAATGDKKAIADIWVLELLAEADAGTIFDIESCIEYQERMDREAGAHRHMRLIGLDIVSDSSYYKVNWIRDGF